MAGIPLNIVPVKEFPGANVLFVTLRPVVESGWLRQHEYQGLVAWVNDAFLDGAYIDEDLIFTVRLYDDESLSKIYKVHVSRLGLLRKEQVG